MKAERLGSYFELVSLEVDDTVLSLVAAAAMTDGDSAVAVSTGVLLNGLQQSAHGLGMLIDTVESGNSHVSAGRGIRLETLNSHFVFSPF